MLKKGPSHHHINTGALELARAQQSIIKLGSSDALQISWYCANLERIPTMTHVQMSQQHIVCCYCLIQPTVTATADVRQITSRAKLYLKSNYVFFWPPLVKVWLGLGTLGLNTMHLEKWSWRMWTGTELWSPVGISVLCLSIHRPRPPH